MGHVASARHARARAGRRHLHRGGESAVRLSDFSILCCGVLLNALAQLGLKAATRVSGPLVAGDAGVWERALNVLVVPSLWYALGAYGLSVIVWLIGLSRVPVSQAYPLLSLGYVINIGLAWWLLGEVPNVQRVAGIGIIVVGVVLVARS
ncbi:MAG: EamA family transporter [Gammaproteobacteria bacterium]|nr:EamA family transporter [Gammaproteobacteria bacterium]MBV8405617.1 EamA family transporter [Gammaproteobacteria bacterium]